MVRVRVGVHQGSSLGPYLFDMILDVMGRGAIADGASKNSPMVYAVQTSCCALCSTRREEAERKLEEWRKQRKIKD